MFNDIRLAIPRKGYALVVMMSEFDLKLSLFRTILLDSDASSRCIPGYLMADSGIVTPHSFDYLFLGYPKLKEAINYIPLFDSVVYNLSSQQKIK